MRVCVCAASQGSPTGLYMSGAGLSAKQRPLRFMLLDASVLGLENSVLASLAAMLLQAQTMLALAAIITVSAVACTGALLLSLSLHLLSLFSIVSLPHLLSSISVSYLTLRCMCRRFEDLG